MLEPRKMIREKKREYVSLEGTLSQLVERLDQLAAKYSDTAILRMTTNWEGEWDGDFEIEWEREETNAEYLRRIERNKKQAARNIERKEKLKEKQEKEDRALFEKLKKKYG